MPSVPGRFSFVASLAAAIVLPSLIAASRTAPPSSAPAASELAAPIPVLSDATAVRWNMPIELHAKSQGVTWNGETLHLLEYSSIQLAVDDAGRLSGVLKGALVTFDDVNYEVSAAVFDAAGLLIGTARATCHVDRVWLGRVLMMPSELALDFGVSKAFPRAAWVTVGISECTVRTPDEWQRGG